MLRRSPIRRDTARSRAFAEKRARLERKTPIARHTRLKPARKYARRASRIVDSGYRVWITTLDCCRCNASAPSHPHHRTLTGRGKSQKSDDTECMPLCFDCHRDLHALTGRFRGFTRARLDEWQRAQVEFFRGWYARLFGPAAEVA